MTRKDFLLNACSICVSATIVSALLPACNISQHVTGRVVENGITIRKDEFKLNSTNATAYRSFIIVRNDSLKYPICVYRFSDQEYSALWMQCTHQGAELQASGDFLQCPAHGSEFNNKGMISSGPADKNLRSFPIIINKDELFIDLRKQS